MPLLCRAALERKDKKEEEDNERVGSKSQITIESQSVIGDTAFLQRTTGV